jgi:hypothetical protein
MNRLHPRRFRRISQLMIAHTRVDFMFDVRLYVYVQEQVVVVVTGTVTTCCEYGCHVDVNYQIRVYILSPHIFITRRPQQK